MSGLNRAEANMIIGCYGVTNCRIFTTESLSQNGNYHRNKYHQEPQLIFRCGLPLSLLLKNLITSNNYIGLLDVKVEGHTHVLWLIIIVLNIYVVVLLYRVAKAYRFERIEKLIITRRVRQKINCRRKIWLKSFNNKEIIASSPTLSPYVSSCAADSAPKSSTTDEWCLKPIKQSNEQNLQQSKNRWQQKQQQKQHQLQIQAVQHGQRQGRWQSQLEQRFFQRPPVISPSSSSSSRTPRSQVSLPSAKVRQQGASDSNKLHRLLLTDSYGRVMQEIPFCECDYAEAVRRACGGDGGGPML
uniref:Uncharacterized protein n=1 Tax=Glossina palpalis gambiensis TaxID=67801 RepID=A0A1B0BG33_9MUSC